MEPERSTAGLQAAQGKLTCPLCGGDGVTTTMHRHTFRYGSGESAVELTVDLPVRRCGPCDTEYIDEVGEDLKHEALCEHFGVLSPDEIRRVREHYGMTRAEFAEITGIGEASLNRWENGINIQTHAYDRYLRLLASAGIMQHLQEMVQKGPTPRAVSSGDERQFRALEVTDDVRRDQENFRLRLAA